MSKYNRYKTRTDKQGKERTVHVGGWRKQEQDKRDLHFGHKYTAATLPTSVDLRAGLSTVEDQGSLGSCTANMLAGMVEANELKRSRAALQQAMDTLARPSNWSRPLFPAWGYFDTLFTLNTSNVEVDAAKPKVTVTGVTVGTDGTISFTVSVKPVAAPAPTPTPPPAPPAPPTPPPPAPKTFTDISRRFQYYATRLLEGTVNEDSGATIRDTLKASAQYGVTDEKLWPYVTADYAVKPPQSVWDAAAKYKVTAYHSIADGDLTSMKAALADGYLVGFGFTVYSYFMSQDMATTGVLCLPTKSEFIEGGHAVCLCGYDDKFVCPDGSVGAFLVRNSWGKDWGLAGYFWMSYKYVANTSLCSDFWVITASPV